MSIQKLKAHLANKSEKELTREIIDLYQQFSVVKDFYNLQLSAHEAYDIIAKHKMIIQNEFLPKRGFGDARLSVARKSVMDFKKLVGVHENLVDLALYYVEIGVQYTNAYGDIDEPFYNSMESMFTQAMKWMKQLDIAYQFQPRAAKICHDTEGIGWGFYDELCETYSNYFDEIDFR